MNYNNEFHPDVQYVLNWNDIFAHFGCNEDIFRWEFKEMNKIHFRDSDKWIYIHKIYPCIVICVQQDLEIAIYSGLPFGKLIRFVFCS